MSVTRHRPHTMHSRERLMAPSARAAAQWQACPMADWRGRRSPSPCRLAPVPRWSSRPAHGLTRGVVGDVVRDDATRGMARSARGLRPGGPGVSSRDDVWGGGTACIVRGAEVSGEFTPISFSMCWLYCLRKDAGACAPQPLTPPKPQGAYVVHCVTARYRHTSCPSLS